eukprot:GHVU01050646.1.p1 GENE.GHVU01050646.1~~GHVU01050646.1.p1  ORF type:complete len:116 (-),score=6.62 GHVU01050646.1:144-491(-)
MKIVALISGGKDSIFNMQCCVAEGHEPVAVAHLKPRADEAEPDSYMYQSIGTELVAPIADCLDLPLFLRTVQGRPVSVDGLDYVCTEALLVAASWRSVPTTTVYARRTLPTYGRR